MEPEELTMAERIEITGPARERYVEILSPRALELLTVLHEALAGRRADVLAARRSRQARLSGGALLDFLPDTAHVRADTAWQVAEPAPGLADRRVEITGPADAATTVSALNSGASVWRADFEDACTPLWSTLIEGQLNLKDALDRTMDVTDGDGQPAVLRPDEELPTIVVRPRGWHLDEKHVLIGGRRASGSLTDFALYLTACAQRQLDKDKGPYFDLPKLESHLEARLWNDAFVLAQDFLGLPRGTIRATAAIETIPAAFEMDEILYELREHCSGLGTGRWDYLFSVIKKFRTRGQDFVLPDREAVTPAAPFMRACTELLVQTCHKRGALALGGAAADGFDGSRVAHPDLVPACRAGFDAVLGGQPNQRGRQRPDVDVTAADLLAVAKTPGRTTEAGLRGSISVCLQYLAAWLGGTGAVTVSGRVEDLSAAEIARAQVWQWIREGVILDGGPLVTTDVVERMIDEELGKIQGLAGDSFDTARYGQAVALFTEAALSGPFAEFLTLSAYERMP
jgi:malate synthase